MTGDRLSPKTENFCIKCKSNPLHGASFEIIDHISPVNEKCSITHCDPKPSERLSTPELISAVGHAWGYASKSLAGLLHKSNAGYESEIIPEGGILRYSTDKGTSHAPTSAGDQPCSVFYLSSKEKSIELVDESRECSSDSYGASYFWRIVLARSTLVEGASVQDSLLGAGIPSNFKSMYNWMNTIALCKPNDLINSEIEIKRAADYYDNCRSTNSGDESSSFHSLATESSVYEPEISEHLDLSSKKAANFDLKPSNTMCSEKKDDALPIEATDYKISTSRCYADSLNAELASHSYDCKNCTKESSKGTYDGQKDQGAMLVKADSSGADISLFGKRKPQYALAKQEHAFAGAMAGIFVSLCLHPVDTVKTVIQACHTSQKPLHYVGRSIIAERGISGLYRGISSNIVSSAPISALYTFTYESVKKSLLPLLPKEYYALAHCTAGGCASIATSFLFTPSECIKQQMQVGSHYKNCWTALIEILQKGGLRSLYAGWGAVLCRNVPHSVIKFYTYESLKHIMSPSNQWNAQANILTTLVCGGLAGSTASFFTTPFDVVKTRLQTQLPGYTAKHSGVLSTLNEIWKHEGLNGVYRGLTPRLVMYMIQGALFFASYESFKSLFSLDFPRPSTQALQFEQMNKDDSEILPSAISVTA